jgi:hypothetical protein
MKTLIRKLLMGDVDFSDYVKVKIDGNLTEKVFLETAGAVKDVSQQHALFCIEPIIFGIWFDKSEWQPQKKQYEVYQLYFGAAPGAGKPEATMTLVFFDCIEDGNLVLLLLKLEKSSVYHLSPLKNFLIYYRYYRRDGMLFPKFKSHVCAYSYPRKIRLVSFRQDDYYNIFPMDLLGDIERHGKFVFGLRHSNIAQQKIIDTRKILVAEVPVEHQKILFQLGKHHSTKPPAISALPFEVMTSKNFSFYIPSWVESYKEINITKTINLGSHLLLYGEVKEKVVLKPSSAHVYMLHFLHLLHQKNRGLIYQRM